MYEKALSYFEGKTWSVKYDRPLRKNIDHILKIRKRGETMNGLELSKEFFYEKNFTHFKMKNLMICCPEILRIGWWKVQSALDWMTIFLSEFMILDPVFVYGCRTEYTGKIKKGFDLLKAELSYKGMGRELNEETSSRLGVFSIESFYYRYTASIPFLWTIRPWLKLPENHLATATNGQIYFDNYGEFTRIRKHLAFLSERCFL